MVMTLAKITAGTGYTYLTRHTARGDAGQGNDRDAAACYTAQGDPPGRWTGRGAPLLGLAGREVTEDQMRALFGVGAPPDMDAMTDAYMDAHWRRWMTGDRLRRLAEDAVRHATLGRQFPEYKQLEPFGQRVETRLNLIRQEAGREPAEAEIRKVKAEEAHRQRAAVAGFDLVFSPVKSAALLWALDERPWVRNAIRDAHEDAKNAALDLLEDHAALTRTGADGVAQIATKGLIAAEFEHWDSRAGDPNLHTHVAISSKVLGADGTWHALDARPLYRMIVAASETYNTAFEAALTARLGVAFTARPDTRGGREPVREITGVPFAMIEFFSRRRAAIEGRYAELVRNYRNEHDHDPSAGAARQLAQQANLDTRQGKKPPRPLADKCAAWREELAARFGPGAVAQLMKAVPSSPPPPVQDSAELPVPVDLKDLAERTVAAVSARRSTWTVWNSIRTASSWSWSRRWASSTIRTGVRPRSAAWRAAGRVPGALPREVQVLRRILSREQVLVLMVRGCGRGENGRMYRARLRGCPRFAVLAGGLALILAGCGTATAPPPGGGSGSLLTSAGSGSLPPSGGSVVYVLDPPRITPVDLAHHRTGRPVDIPGSVAAALVAVTPDHRRAYVLTGTSLVPVSLITGAAGRPLTVPQDSSQVDYLSTDGRTAYLVAGTTITPVDLRTDSAGRPFVLPPLSSNSLDTLLVAAAAPVACLTGITASGPQDYVIECVNLATGTTGKPITVPGAGDSAAALAPDGRSAYIASDSLLVPVNLVTGSTGRPIHTPIHIGAVAVTTDGRTAYVGNLKPYHPGDGVIIPIDLAKGTAHAAISVPSYPYSITDIVISRDGRTAYAAAYSSVIPIDIATGKPAKPIPMPSGVSAVILTA